MKLSDYTIPQQKAITSSGSNIIVSAGAGSGKTQVLTQRVLYFVKNEGYKLENFLILTFTNLAAGEMKERIRKTLLEEGLEEEVKRIYSITSTKTTALQAIGYKEFVPYFQGEISLEDVKETIKKNTRHYVKRQYTWLKNQIEAEWLDVTNLDENDKLNQAVSIIEKRWKNND